MTGSSGLIGGEAVEYFDKQGHEIIGVDNNMRKQFFGEAGDTSWNLHRIFSNTKHFHHEEHDIRDRESLEMHVFSKFSPFDAVIHCAAQPSHDKAKEIPVLDFEVNALGTMNLLELTRQYSPKAVFIFMSTNKVYGDAPNELLLEEKETRFDYATRASGIDEKCRIDQTTHSVFGASKVAADIMVQEYGRYFGMNTCVFRGGCLTGPTHSGVELHGFLSYLVKCAVTGKKYTVFGYKGKQVRDNIHSYDVIRAMEEVIKDPRPGSVYNMGGGSDNNISMLEAINLIEKIINKKMNWEYVDQNRIGDHICYISDLGKFELDYPDWKITKSIDQILSEVIQTEYTKMWWDGKFSTGGNGENLKYQLTKDSVILDIGGYKGDFAEAMSHKYGAKVHIFEPVAEFAEECSNRFLGRAGIVVHRYGLSNCDEDVKITKCGEASSIFVSGAETESIVLKDVASESVLHKKIDLVSMNIEGGEYTVLRRLIETGLIKNCKNVQIQFHTTYTSPANERNEIRELLSQTHIETYCYPFVWENWTLK